MQPTLYIPHGGGPCFFMEWPGEPWKNMEAYLRALPSTLNEQPRAILVISAHWERALPTVTANPQPHLIYDYSGFPAHTYQLRYDAPGSRSSRSASAICSPPPESLRRVTIGAASITAFSFP